MIATEEEARLVAGPPRLDRIVMFEKDMQGIRATAFEPERLDLLWLALERVCKQWRKERGLT